MKREELLQRLEERLARGEISEETYREIKARYDALPEEDLEEEAEAEGAPSDAPEGLDDLGALIEDTLGSVMERVGQRLEDSLGSEDFERRMEEVGDRVRKQLSQLGARVEAGGRRIVISGSGVVALDEPIDTFKCAGSGKVTSDLRAKEVRISGACKIGGECEGQEVHSSGSLKVEGGLRAQEFHSSGSTRIMGDLRGQEIETSGALHVEGSILDSQELRSSGSLEVGGAVRVQEFASRGRFRIGEALEAQEVDIRLRGMCKVPAIQAEEIHVRGGRRRGELRVERITGQEVYLEGTRADLVHGKEVRIGPYCTIGVVEADKLEVHESSTVREQRRPAEAPADEGGEEE